MKLLSSLFLSVFFVVAISFAHPLPQDVPPPIPAAPLVPPPASPDQTLIRTAASDLLGFGMLVHGLVTAHDAFADMVQNNSAFTPSPGLTGLVDALGAAGAAFNGADELGSIDPADVQAILGAPPTPAT